MNIVPHTTPLEKIKTQNQRPESVLHLYNRSSGTVSNYTNNLLKRQQRINSEDTAGIPVLS